MVLTFCDVHGWMFAGASLPSVSTVKNTNRVLPDVCILDVSSYVHLKLPDRWDLGTHLQTLVLVRDADTQKWRLMREDNTPRRYRSPKKT